MISLFSQSFWNSPSILSVAIGGGVACLVLTVFAYRMGIGRKRSHDPSLLDDDRRTWSPPEGTGADRRVAVRREGQPVPVFLNSAVLQSDSEPAFVVDRSTGGLKIVCGRNVPVGSTIQVKAENAPNTVPWITVVVRSCRENAKRFELGCEFDKTPPWNVLLLFG